MNELSIIKAVLLGALQGATEFLPVSSSGHLVIAQSLLGVKLENGGLVAFDVCLHFGTLVAIIAVFWRDIAHILASFFRRVTPDSGQLTNPQEGCMTDWQARRVGIFLIVATIPAAIVGPFLKNFMDRIITDAQAAGFMLLITGAILFCTRFAKKDGVVTTTMKWWHALGIGIAQAIAIIPGISRSGSTISGGLYLGLDRTLAARFAFLLAVPAIGGAAVLKFKELTHLSHDIMIATTAGTIVAAVVGIACIKWLLGIIRRGHFSWFAYYCWAVGVATIIVFHAKG